MSLTLKCLFVALKKVNIEVTIVMSFVKQANTPIKHITYSFSFLMKQLSSGCEAKTRSSLVKSSDTLAITTSSIGTHPVSKAAEQFVGAARLAVVSTNWEALLHFLGKCQHDL